MFNYNLDLEIDCDLMIKHMQKSYIKSLNLSKNFQNSKSK